MGSPTKFWTESSIKNCSKYLIFLNIPINLLLWGCEIWALHISLLKKLEVFLHHSIQRMPGINISEVKEQRITNETVRKKLFDIPNIEKQIATRQLTFIGKVARNFDDHLPTELLTTWCNHRRLRGGVLHTNKKFILNNPLLIIPGVEKNRALKTWAHFPLMTNTGGF